MTDLRTTTAAGLIAVAGFATLTAAAAAAPALGLTGDRTLVMFDTAKPDVTKSMDVAGVDRLLGIDVRPATGEIIGVTTDGTIVVIDPASGAATKKSKMDVMLPVTGNAPVIVDFNPVADRLRFMSGTVNHRVDVDSGKVTVDGPLAFEAKDMHANEKPAIVAAAYTNSAGKPQSTAMYDIDATIVALIRQVSPNDGTLAAVGKLGIDKAESYAFDVQTTADGTNTAWLAAGGKLYTVNLESGKAEPKGEITGARGALRDIAIRPAM